MNLKSFVRKLMGRLLANKASRRKLVRRPQLAMVSVSQAESLEPRMLMTADPDDQIRDALQLGTVATSATRNDSINVAIDVDIYRVDVVAGQRLSFDIDRLTGSQLDSYIRLFDSAGRQLAFSDDTAAPGEVRGLDSYLEFTFASAGSFYLGVSGFGNRNYNALTGLGDRNGRTGAYSLVVNSISMPGGTTDSDDQISEAVNLSEAIMPVTQTGVIDSATDVDMYRFTLNTTRRVQIDIDRPSGSLDSFLRVFDSNGVEIARNDDGPTPGESNSMESFLELNLSAGTYFLSVSGFGNSSFNAVTGTGDTSGSMGAYSLIMTPDTDSDDQISQAIDLGTVSSTMTRTGLSIEAGTDVDMYRFMVSSGQRVRFDIDSSSAGYDSFIRLFDAAGNELARNDDGPTPGESSSLESYLEFTFATGGSYFLGVSGFGNSSYNAIAGGGDLNGSTGQYSLEVALTTTQPTPPPPPPVTGGNRVLYLNFDGVSISRSDLIRYAGNDWSGMVNQFDADQNGIVVQPLLSSRGDREQIISQIISMVQIDLNPFGITVMRTMGGAVEGQGVSTIFLGRSTLSNDFYHVACDVDFNNNNRTDIAFVGDENWGSVSNTAIALADVTLHEAGHTFGLYHVQSGTSPESMGLRYNTPQSSWVTDTSFMNQSFNELPGHGGGRGPQNAFQYMRGIFPVNGSQPTGGSSGNPLSPQQVRDLLAAGYGEGAHNLPIQDGFAPKGGHADHDHDHHDDETAAVFAVASRQETTRLSSDLVVSASNTAVDLTRMDSALSDATSGLSDSYDENDQVASSDHAELDSQFGSASWGSLLESLHSMS